MKKTSNIINDFFFVESGRGFVVKLVTAKVIRQHMFFFT